MALRVKCDNYSKQLTRYPYQLRNSKHKKFYCNHDCLMKLISEVKIGNKDCLGQKRPELAKKRLGSGNPAWKGGRHLSYEGHVQVLSRDHPKQHGGYVKEHVLVAEKKIGRYLKKGEIVHHKNGIKIDNRKKNLEVMTISDHVKLHAKQRTIKTRRIR